MIKRFKSNDYFKLRFDDGEEVKIHLEPVVENLRNKQDSCKNKFHTFLYHSHMFDDLYKCVDTNCPYNKSWKFTGTDVEGNLITELLEPIEHSHKKSGN